MLSNYCCAQMSNFKRLRLLGHTLWQGYDVRPVNTFCTFCSSNEGKSSIAPERLYHETIRFSKKIMVSAGVSMQGKTCIIFIDPQRTKVNGEHYVGLLRDKLIPECRRLYPDDNYIFQQDSAPSHRCRLAQQFLQANTPDFIHSDAWPPNSPDLNPLDYYVWNALKELVYAGRRKPCLNTDELKQVIEEKWSLLNDRHIQKSIGQWKQRLKVVTREGGGPIKHLLA